MADTVFDKIVRGEIPVDRIYEDDICLAFRDIAPIAPVHFLLIPKVAIASLAETSPQHTEMLGHLLAKAGELGRQLAPEGFRVVINTGGDGGQTVDHLHLHILGGRRMTWPPG